MQRIGRYEILGELGRGAMGVVFRAEDPVIGRTVAIKTIRLSAVSSPDEQRLLRDRLFREARSAGVLAHPNIVTVYDIGEDGELAFIAMEFVAGSTLEEVSRRGQPLTIPTLMSILREVASALDYAHGKGIVHRDIKPGNIMIAESGAAKITDFGVAKIASQRVTQTGLVMGTPSYMSPEQIEANDQVDGRSDQFSLGVIVYEMLTGDKPFSSESLPGLLLKIVRSGPEPAHKLNATLSEGVSTVIDRALAKNKVDRYPTCGAFVQDLNSAIEACGISQAVQAEVSPDSPTAMATTPFKKSGTANPATSSPVTKTPTQAPAQPPVQAPPVATVQSLPPLQRRTLMEEVAPETSGAKKWIGAVAAIGLLGAVGFGVMRYLARPAEAVPVEPEPPKVSASTAPAKPSPSIPAPPAQVTPTSTSPVAAPAVETPKRPPAPVAPAEQHPAEVKSAIVEFSSVPAGAKMRVDDTSDGCTTPCSLEVAAGRHVFRYELAGHHPTVSVVVVPQETKSFVRMEAATGTLIVMSTPAGADVFVNGEGKGKTPATIKLTAGKIRIEVKKDGLPDRVREMEIRDGEFATYEVTWK
ncbi:MAG: protein kinase [Bryobacteraceae bacterium]